MKKLIPYLILVILLFLIFKQRESIKSLNLEIKNTSGKTDTVFKDRYFESPTPYKDIQIPKTLIVYKTRVDTVYSVRLSGDTITLYFKTNLNLNKQLQLNTQYLTQFPESDKLISLDLTKKKLSLGLVTLTGEVIEKIYPVDLNGYNYRYVNQTLTYKKKSIFTKIKPTVEYMYRPLNNFHDVNIGLIYKTGLINYEIGLNGHHYNFKESQFGIDPYLRIKFEF